MESFGGEFGVKSGATGVSGSWFPGSSFLNFTQEIWSSPEAVTTPEAKFGGDCTAVKEELVQEGPGCSGARVPRAYGSSGSRMFLRLERRPLTLRVSDASKLEGKAGRGRLPCLCRHPPGTRRDPCPPEHVVFRSLLRGGSMAVEQSRI